ncbi:MAG: flagellar M-ring protein FliF [Actinomycetota bacterium]|nr:flagellar M-ring protein FliF [Actinomycetota bacterium]
MAALDVDGLKRRGRQLFASFSPSQLVIIALLTVVSVVAALAFLRWVSAPTYGVLLAGLDAEDAAAVTAKLDADGVEYELEQGGSTVLVPKELLDEQRIAVAAAGLPAGKTESGWGAFDDKGLTSSSFQQQVAYQRAMQSELSKAVEGIDGVRRAEVHLALPEKKLFTEQQEKPRASVLVEADGSLSDDAVDAISHLVASSVPGLAPGEVSITDSTGQLLTGQGASAAGDRATKQRQAYEDQLSSRVTSMFDTLLGPGKAVVRVNAEMDTSNRTIDSETFDRDKTAVLSQSATEETYETVPDGQTQGTLTQPATTSTTTDAGGYTKKQTATQNGVSRTVERQVVSPGGVERLTVAVAVDRNAPNAPAPAELQALVANAVGLDPSRGDTIAVTTPSFLQEDPAAAEETTEDEGATAAAGQYAAPALGALLLLLVGIGFLRTVRKGTVTEIPVEQVTAAIDAAGGRRGRRAAELPAATVPALPAAQSAPSEEGLLELLDENPDEIAGLLRGWLTTAGSDR